MATQNNSSSSPVRRSAAAIAAVVAMAAPFSDRFEGVKLKAYADVVHGWAVPTVCGGHTGPDVLRDTEYTREQCAQIRDADLTSHLAGLDRCMRLDIPTHELAAFLLLTMNVGPSRVCNSSIPIKLKQYRDAEACATISDFYMAGGRDCRAPENQRICGGIPKSRAVMRSICEGKIR